MNIFDIWNKLKKEVDAHDNKDIYFYEGDIWFIKAGKNIGFEQDGTGNSFLRPVLILRKFNKDIFWGVFLSTKIKQGKYYTLIHNSGGKKAVAILSQIRLLSSKRLHTKIGVLSRQETKKIKKAISNILLDDIFEH